MDNHTAEHKLRTAEFIPVADKLFAEKKTFLALFKGAVDSHGQSWCSDCVAAEPTIKSVLLPLAKKKNIPVYTVDVGQREEWKDKQNPLRVHSGLKVDCVPTAIFVHDGVARERLREGDLTNRELIEAMFGN